MRLFYTVEHAALLMGISVRQFRRYIERGDIDVMRIGHRHFIIGKTLEKFIQTKLPLKSCHV